MAGTYTNLIYHMVFSTKERAPLLTDDVASELYPYIGGIIRGEGGVALEIGGMADHLHLLVQLKPKPSVADVLMKIKGNSSKWMNEQQKCSCRFGWQEGYGAFSVSESQVPVVAKYIQSQEDHHRSRGFKEEFIEFLEKHGIEYDDRYIWH